MKVKTAGIFFVILAAMGLLAAVAVKSFARETESVAIVPQPQRVECHAGSFQFSAATLILVEPKGREAGQFLAERLRKATGYSFRVTTSRKSPRGNIQLTTDGAKTSLAPEGYQLIVSPSSIIIRAPSQAGMFYGVQSLLQLLPPEVFAAQAPLGHSDWSLSCVSIEDQPRFAWRGLLLDVSRHFFNKEEIKQLLDLMALHKLNTLHWHLTDDQGWRLEIKKYPYLTQKGAWRKDIAFGLDPKASTAYGPDGRYGGFYTQADVRELVAYAQARHITIVPEIEMPGHSCAALSVFPQLSCSGGPYSTDQDGGVFAGVYCAGNEQTFEFLQNVLTEVLDLFPSKYIHIGGDEVPKENWKKCAKCQARMKAEGLKTEHELQSYFIRRIEKFVNSKGRNLIGWSEIREGGLAQNAAVMDWIGGAVEAASAGHNVVMTPEAYCYFDHYQSTNRTAEPRAIGGFLPLAKVYSFEPIPEKLAPEFQAHILGPQANLWTEYVPSFKHAQYMLFPRLCAMAEVGWSPKTACDYSSFTRRMQVHLRRLDELGVNYRKTVPGE